MLPFPCRTWSEFPRSKAVSPTSAELPDKILPAMGRGGRCGGRALRSHMGWGMCWNLGMEQPSIPWPGCSGCAGTGLVAHVAHSRAQLSLAVTVPLLYQGILEMRFWLWMPLLRHQIAPGTWLLCWCEISINIPQRIAPGSPGLVSIRWSRAGDSGLSLLPHDLLHPQKNSSPRGEKPETVWM